MINHSYFRLTIKSRLFFNFCISGKKQATQALGINLAAYFEQLACVFAISVFIDR